MFLFVSIASHFGLNDRWFRWSRGTPTQCSTTWMVFWSTRICWWVCATTSSPYRWYENVAFRGRPTSTDTCRYTTRPISFPKSPGGLPGGCRIRPDGSATVWSIKGWYNRTEAIGSFQISSWLESAFSWIHSIRRANFAESKSISCTFNTIVIATYVAGQIPRWIFQSAKSNCYVNKDLRNAKFKVT